MDLKKPLRLHKLWLAGEEGGIRLDLSNTDLRYADLSNTNLSHANLSCANLSHANLIDADLSSADLRCANLRCAILNGTDLRDADLRYSLGNNKELKTLQLGKYQVTYSEDTMAIGCRQYPISQWFSFRDEDIEAMDDGALEWWKTWKSIIKNIRETT